MRTNQDKVHDIAHTGGTLRRRVAMLTVGAAALAIPLAGVTSQPASASVRYAAVGDGLALRAGPGTQYVVRRTVNNGTPLDIVCQVQGGTNIRGNATWDKLVGGEWVADYYTTTPSFNSYVQGLVDCNAPTGPIALSTNQALLKGQASWSANHRFCLIMQTDGNLVLYDTSGPRWVPWWASMTFGSGNYATIGWDGNFVVKSSSGAVIWQTTTRWPGREGNGTLYVQDDGNVVIYDALGEWTWASATWAGPNLGNTGGTIRPPANNGLQLVVQGTAARVSVTGFTPNAGVAWDSPTKGSQTPVPGLWWGSVSIYKDNVFATKCYLPRFTTGRSNTVVCTF